MDKMESMARDSYFRQSEMVEFLLVENLALKTLLHEKGIIDKEEYKVCQKRAEAILKEKTTAYIEEWKRLQPNMAKRISDALTQTQALRSVAENPSVV
jgi:hypothetical protein